MSVLLSNCKQSITSLSLLVGTIVSVLLLRQNSYFWYSKKNRLNFCKESDQSYPNSIHMSCLYRFASQKIFKDLVDWFSIFVLIVSSEPFSHGLVNLCPANLIDKSLIIWFGTTSVAKFYLL